MFHSQRPSEPAPKSMGIPPAHKRKPNPDENFFSKVNEPITVIQEVPANCKQEDEYDTFCKHICSQLRQLPTRDFIILQEKIQSLITHRRLLNLEQSQSHASVDPVSNESRCTNVVSPNNESQSINVVSPNYQSQSVSVVSPNSQSQSIIVAAPNNNLENMEVPVVTLGNES